MPVSFGCVTGTCTYGTMNSSGSTATAEIGQCRNALGVVTNEQAYSRTVKSTITAVLTGSAPAAGATNTLFGNAGLLESVAVTETNTGYSMIEATVTKSDSSTQTVLA